MDATAEMRASVVHSTYPGATAGPPGHKVLWREANRSVQRQGASRAGEPRRTSTEAVTTAGARGAPVAPEKVKKEKVKKGRGRGQPRRGNGFQVIMYVKHQRRGCQPEIGSQNGIRDRIHVAVHFRSQNDLSPVTPFFILDLARTQYRWKRHKLTLDKPTFTP